MGAQLWLMSCCSLSNVRVATNSGSQTSSAFLLLPWLVLSFAENSYGKIEFSLLGGAECAFGQHILEPRDSIHVRIMGLCLALGEIDEPGSWIDCDHGSNSSIRNGSWD